MAIVLYCTECKTVIGTNAKDIKKHKCKGGKVHEFDTGSVSFKKEEKQEK